jgi:hypothetical protein
MTKRSVYHFKCAVILERLHQKKNKFRLLDDGFRLFEWDAGRKAFAKAIAKIYPQLDSTRIKIIVIGIKFYIFLLVIIRSSLSIVEHDDDTF